MFRRLMYLFGVVSLLGVLFPSPSSAGPAPFATAIITGAVAEKDVQPDPPCHNDANGKGASDSPGKIVEFTGLEMAGAFGNLDNQFVGSVKAKGPVEACSVPRPNTLPPPLDEIAGALTGWGKILPGQEFNGDPLVPVEDTPLDKCVRGDILGGDFNNFGVVALVKFHISFGVGDFDPPFGDKGCVIKKTVSRVNCVGFIGVVPRESLMVGPQDDVAGAIVCNELMPTNKP